MTQFNKRQLENVYYLTVQDITFASTAIGDPTNGRSAATAWSQDDTVVFKGKLKHILTFALMAFDVASVAVNELFEIVPEREFLNVQNLSAADIVEVIDLDPTQGEGIVVDDDMTFLTNITNNFRLGPNDMKNVVVEEKAAPANKALYKSSVINAIAYAFQVHQTGNAVTYTLFDFALMDVAAGVTKGVEYVDIDGSLGPVELDKAHSSLASLVLSAPMA
jgi:hypothetical protein